MLYMTFCDRAELRRIPNLIWGPNEIFNEIYDTLEDAKQWLNDPLVRRAIAEIDHVELIEGEPTELSIMKHGMRVYDLSTGTKNLILCKFVNGVSNGERMGPNCYKFLGEIAQNRPVYQAVSCQFYPRPELFLQTPIFVGNTNRVYRNRSEWDEDDAGFVYRHARLEGEWVCTQWYKEVGLERSGLLK